MENQNVYIDLGKVEAVLTPNEQIPGEIYQYHERMKTYIVEVKRTNKGPQIMVSRTHPGLLKRLFELEVPEIHDGVVEIKSVAREPGMRSKISVYTADSNVDPVGACVGLAIGKEGQNARLAAKLTGWKIDIKSETQAAEEAAAEPAPVEEA